MLRWVPNNTRVSTHIVAFDMDGTLIKTKSGVLWPSRPEIPHLWRGIFVVAVVSSHEACCSRLQHER